MEKQEEKVCPICGQKYNTREFRTYNQTKYVYFIHKWKDENGKKHIHKCYGGAVNLSILF
jgi:hypothetical protein